MYIKFNWKRTVVHYTVHDTKKSIHIHVYSFTHTHKGVTFDPIVLDFFNFEDNILERICIPHSWFIFCLI